MKIKAYKEGNYTSRSVFFLCFVARLCNLEAKALASFSCHFAWFSLKTSHKNTFRLVLKHEQI